MARRVLFYGDSNTFGYDPTGSMGGRYPEASRWTSILQRNVRGAWQVLADGFPGRSIPASDAAWEYLRSVVHQAMPLDLFAVMLGTNDILGTLHPDAAKTAVRMDALLSFVEEAAADAMPKDPAIVHTSFPGVQPRRRRLPQLLLIVPPKFRLTDGTTDEPIDQLTSQPADQLTGQPADQLTSQPADQLTGRPADRCIDWPIDQSPDDPYAWGDWTYEQMYEKEGKKLSQYYREIAEKRGIWFVDSSEWELDFAFDGVHLSQEGNAEFAFRMTQVLRDIQRWS